MASFVSLTPNERESLYDLPEEFDITTANGEVTAKYGAQVYVQMLAVYVTVIVLDEADVCVLSLGLVGSYKFYRS